MLRSKYTKSIIAGLFLTTFLSSSVFANDLSVAASGSTAANTIQIGSAKVSGIGEVLSPDIPALEEPILLQDKVEFENSPQSKDTPVNNIAGEIKPLPIHPNRKSGTTSGSSAANSTPTGTAKGNGAGEVLSPDIAALNEPMFINEGILKKQQEIDKYLFESNSSDIAKKNFKVTHTGPFEDYVEIGIIPYSKENAEYLYNIFGDEIIRVVEGIQAELLSLQTSADSSEYIATSVKDMTANVPNRGSSTLIYSAFAIAASLLLGVYVLIRRKTKPTSN